MDNSWRIGPGDDALNETGVTRVVFTRKSEYSPLLEPVSPRMLVERLTKPKHRPYLMIPAKPPRRRE